MSSVNRVDVSNVLIPRSQRITSEFPSLTMYSAAISRSSTVDERPRFSSTGFGARPTSERSEKFDMLRAPIWITSATSTTASTWRGSISSVTSGRPGLLARLHEDLERLVAEPLERVRRRARLEGAAAEHRHALGGDAARGLERLLARLDACTGRR